MPLRLLEVLAQAPLVRRARGHRDVRLERGLELLLLAVGLVEVLDQLRVAGGRLWHLVSRGRWAEPTGYPGVASAEHKADGPPESGPPQTGKPRGASNAPGAVIWARRGPPG